MAESQKCVNCRFWNGSRDHRKDHYHSDRGQCRRYPPAVRGNGNFPLTEFDAWCGEWSQTDD